MSDAWHKPFLEPHPDLSRIEQQAAACLDTCCRGLELTEIPLPVPVDVWIERPLGYEFGIGDLSHLGEGVLGATFIRDREIMVSETLLDHDGRYRFTCAHELGHMLLHADVQDVFHDVHLDTARVRRGHEWQADRFAAAFLMPLPIVVRELYRIAEEFRLDARACITQLMLDTPESTWLWKKRFLPEITRRCGVSLTTALNRFGDLCLPDRKPFLLRSHRDRLLRPMEKDDPIANIRIVAGVPKSMPSRETLDSTET